MGAKKIKKNVTTKSVALDIVNKDCAGIDVGATSMQVCVPNDRAEVNNRCFGTTTSELRNLCLWLSECGITKVLMESTGCYWKPLYRMLLEHGFKADVVNAADVKNMSGRKTDVDDATWLRDILAYGIYTPCFQSDSLSKKICAITRFRDNYIKDGSKAVNRMQKAMEMMNIKLTEVISDITGVSGRRIIEAILEGERDPEILVSYVDGRCKTPKEQIAEALEGTWDEDLIFMLSESYEDYNRCLEKVRKCDLKIESVAFSELGGVVIPEENRVKKHKSGKSPGMDIESMCHAAYGVNIMEIPGVSHSAALVILSELGRDFIEKFSTPGKFCKWCGLVPNIRITGGYVISSRVTKSKNRVGQALRQCAQSLSRCDNELGVYYRRMRAKSGGLQANLATAHKLGRILYMMIKTQSGYDPSKLKTVNKSIIEKRLDRMRKATAKLEKELANAI